MTNHREQNFTQTPSAESTGFTTATLGGGCFWCMEAIYQQVNGVISVESGYAGGHTPKPNYESVCSGQTGHAEVVRIHFDPAMISYEQLLEIFFAIHDPTTLNRQGHDVGTQYRSVIYFHNDEQEAQAKHVMERLNAPEFFDGQIVTELSPLPEYFKAEEYHQNYFNQHPYQGYCAFVISPKLSKFRKQFASLLSELST